MQEILVLKGNNMPLIDENRRFTQNPCGGTMSVMGILQQLGWLSGEMLLRQVVLLSRGNHHANSVVGQSDFRRGS